MKTWVFCVESSYAKVFQASEEKGLRYCNDVIKSSGERTRFFRHLAKEIETSCERGSNRFLICGDPAVVNDVCQCLTDEARSLIIGIVPRNIIHESVERIRVCTSKLVESWARTHGYEFCA